MAYVEQQNNEGEEKNAFPELSSGTSTPGGMAQSSAPSSPQGGGANPPPIKNTGMSGAGKGGLNSRVIAANKEKLQDLTNQANTKAQAEVDKLQSQGQTAYQTAMDNIRNANKFDHVSKVRDTNVAGGYEQANAAALQNLADWKTASRDFGNYGGDSVGTDKLLGKSLKTAGLLTNYNPYQQAMKNLSENELRQSDSVNWSGNLTSLRNKIQADKAKALEAKNTLISSTAGTMLPQDYTTEENEVPIVQNLNTGYRPVGQYDVITSAPTGKISDKAVKEANKAIPIVSNEDEQQLNPWEVM